MMWGLCWISREYGLNSRIRVPGGPGTGRKEMPRRPACVRPRPLVPHVDDVPLAHDVDLELRRPAQRQATAHDQLQHLPQHERHPVRHGLPTRPVLRTRAAPPALAHPEAGRAGLHQLPQGQEQMRRRGPSLSLHHIPCRRYLPVLLAPSARPSARPGPLLQAPCRRCQLSGQQCVFEKPEKKNVQPLSTASVE